MRNLRSELDEVPPLGDIDAAVWAGTERRPRRRIRDVAVLAAACATVVAVIGATQLVPDSQDTSRREPATSPAATSPWNEPAPVSDRIREWVPEARVVGTAAPEDAVLGRRCQGDACEWTLRRQGLDLPVRDVSPRLDDLLSGLEPSDVTLSFDGQWMSLDAGDSVRVQALDPRRADADPLVLEPGSPTGTWDVVGWGSGSMSVALVETGSDGLPVRYAVVDLLTTTVEAVEAPQPARLGPVGDLGDAMQVASRNTGPEATSRFATQVVGVWDDPSLPRGELTVLSDRPEDVSALLADGETLAGPAGLPEVLHPPVGTDGLDWPLLTVFGPGGGRVGVIRLVRGEPLRFSVAPGWTGLGANRSGAVLELKATEESSLIRARGGDGGVMWSLADDGVADWVVPGLVR